MSRAAATCALSATLAVTLPAQDPFEDLPGLGDMRAASPQQGPRVTNLSGFVETRGRFFFRDRDRGRAAAEDDGQWLQEVQLEFDVEFAPALSGYFRPRFQVGVFDPDLVRTEPLEAFVTWDLGRHELRAGQLVENWGIADTFNPVDVLNRRDVAEDPLDPVRLGELGVRHRWFLDGDERLGEPTISTYFMPVFRRALFPGVESRWSFDPSSQAGPAAPRLDESLGDEPNGSDRLFWAVRAQGTLTTALANADLQLVFARGPDKFPLFEVVPGTAGGVLAPTYFGSTALGGGLRAVPNSAALSDYTLKAEVVYKQPFRFDGRPTALPDDYVQYAFGFDRLFPNVFAGNDLVTATVEWVGEQGAADLTSLYRPFDDDLVLRLLWEANDFARQRVELRGVADFVKREFLLEASYQTQLRELHEDLKLEVGVRWFELSGDEPGFFDLFPDNSSVWTSLRFDF